MGSVWKGSKLTLGKNIRAMDPEPSPEIFSSKELAAINIAKKVCTHLCLEKTKLHVYITYGVEDLCCAGSWVGEMQPLVGR